MTWLLWYFIASGLVSVAYAAHVRAAVHPKPGDLQATRIERAEVQQAIRSRPWLVPVLWCIGIGLAWPLSLPAYAIERFK